MTELHNKVNIVASVWLDHRTEFAEFIHDYDLGCPLAGALVLGGVVRDGGVTEIGSMWITEAFDGLVEVLGLDPFAEYETLDQMLEIAGYE
jgi:hypothetical protein